MQRAAPIVMVSVAIALSVSGCGRGSTSASLAASSAEVAATAPVGSSAAATTAPTETDCSYIAPAQLSSIEGATYAAPTSFHSICQWTGSDGNALSITLTRNATEPDWRNVLDTVQGDQRTDLAPIAGLGDRAQGAGLEIAVQHGSTIIDIRNGDSPGFGKWPKSAAIANTIIAGLH